MRDYGGFMALKRNLRITCRIPCEITYGRSRSRATVVDVSERGLGIETGTGIGEGEAVRIRLHPNRATGSIELRGIIWNERTRMKSGGRGSSQVLGLMLSDTPDTFLALVAKLGGRDHDSRAVRRPQRIVSSTRVACEKPRAESCDDGPIRIIQDIPADSVLPRPKFPLPPLKLSEEESLPLYRVRVKQVDGPRTRRVEIRARSENDVASRVSQVLEGEWEVLEVRLLAAKGQAGPA